MGEILKEKRECKFHFYFARLNKIICLAEGGAKMSDMVFEGVSAKDLSGIYSEIAEEFDMDTAYRIYQCFKGLQLTFPFRFYSSDCLHQHVIAEYNGSNVKQIAKKYGFSERRIRQIIASKRNLHKTKEESEKVRTACCKNGT